MIGWAPERGREVITPSVIRKIQVATNNTIKGSGCVNRVRGLVPFRSPPLSYVFSLNVNGRATM